MMIIVILILDLAFKKGSKGRVEDNVVVAISPNCHHGLNQLLCWVFHYYSLKFSSFSVGIVSYS